MKPTRSLQFLASSIAALTIAHTASGVDYDANTTITGAVSSSTGLRVGVTNPNITLTVDNGGSLGITAGSIDFGSSNEALVVNGTGTLNFATGSGKNLNLNSGSGQSITVQSGGKFTITGNGGTLYMASTSATIPNTLTVTGSGSTFTNGDASNGANIWLSGSNNQITVSNGAVFTSLYRGIYVPGRWGGNTNNSLTITGGGQLRTNSLIGLSPASDGTATYITMMISGGGEAYSNGGRIGYWSGNNYNTATITGSGSLWNLGSGTLSLGSHTGAQNNTLNVSNGGALNNVGSVLMNGTNNQFNLGSGSAALLSTATANTVTLGSTGALLNFDNGRLIARADGALVTGTGSIVLNGDGRISTTFAGSTIGTAISGSGTLVKEGSGTLTLNGSTATYSGSATVSEGTLALTTLSPGSGKTLKGNGTVSGVIDMTNGSTFAYEVNSDTVTGNLLTVNGAVTLENSNGDKVYLTLDDLAATDVAFATGTKFSLMNYSSTLNGQFFYGASTTPLAEGGTFDTALNRWTINYSDSTGGSNFIGTPAGSFINLTAGALTAIPEPGSLLALGCLVGSGAFLRSRRRTV